MNGTLDVLAEARLALENGEPEEAFAVARSGLASFPEDRVTRLFLADILGRHGRPEEAVAVLAAVVDDAPDDAELLNHLGVAQRRRGDFAAATRSFREAARLDPSGPWAFHNVAMALLHDPGERAREMVAALAAVSEE